MRIGRWIPLVGVDAGQDPDDAISLVSQNVCHPEAALVGSDLVGVARAYCNDEIGRTNSSDQRIAGAVELEQFAAMRKGLQPPGVRMPLISEGVDGQHG